MATAQLFKEGVRTGSLGEMPLGANSTEEGDHAI